MDGSHDEGSRESTSSHNTLESNGELDGPLIASGELDCQYCRKPFNQVSFSCSYNRLRLRSDFLA